MRKNYGFKVRNLSKLYIDGTHLVYCGVDSIDNGFVIYLHLELILSVRNEGSFIEGCQSRRTVQSLDHSLDEFCAWHNCLNQGKLSLDIGAEVEASSFELESGIVASFYGVDTVE